MSNELMALLDIAESHLRRKEYSSALPHLHKVFVYSGEVSEIRALACVRLAVSCWETGQMLIGSEFMREAESIARVTCTRRLSEDLLSTSPILKPMDSVECEMTSLINAVTGLWHRLGVPFWPAKENLRLVNVHRVDEPAPFFSNISWYCQLPLLSPNSAQPLAQGLLTVFDIGLGPHVVERYLRTVEYLEHEPEQSLVDAQRSDTIAFTLRVSQRERAVLEVVGRQFENDGVPLELIKTAPRSAKGDDFVEASNKLARQGADLFVLTLLREARRLYQDVGDRKGVRLAMINECLAMRRLGRIDDAARIWYAAWTEGKAVNDFETTDALESIGMYRQNEVHRTAANGEPGERQVPSFVYDPSSGKVIGGMYAAEAEAEARASQLLNDAWRLEFPDVPSPFHVVVSHSTFRHHDSSFLDESPTGTFELGNLLRLAPLEGSIRLSHVDVVEIPQGQTSEACVAEFVGRVAGALLVAHKRVEGAYSSGAGTSISPGNVSTRGHVFDYETFRSPALGDTEDLRAAQISDLVNAIKLILTFIKKLGRSVLLARALQLLYICYCRSAVVDSRIAEVIKGIEPDDAASPESRMVLATLAKALHEMPSWRN
jgi:hypothetical protein